MTYPTAYIAAASPPSGGPRQGSRNLMAAVLAAHPGATNLGIYNPRDVCGNTWPNFKCAPSQHATGRACDFGIPPSRRPSLGEAIAQALVAHAPELGISEVIWNRRRWIALYGWRTYTGRSPHLDHVHVTLHPEAADRLTATEAKRALMAKPVAAVSLAPSGPAVAARGDLLTVFTRADDGALRARAADGAAWETLGGKLTSEPAAVSWGGSRLDVFARGTDGALWHLGDGSTWAAWESLAGQITSSPAVASWGPDRLDVFARGDGGGLWHRPWTGAAWGAWANLGGQLGSAPAAVSWGPNRVDVFTRGADSALWHVWWDGKSWSGWQTLGGKITSAPAAVSTAPDRLDVFARGEDSALWRAAWDGRAWTWDRLGGLLTSAPAAAARPGRVDVYAVGADGKMWRRTRDRTGWGVWAPAWPTT